MDELVLKSPRRVFCRYNRAVICNLTKENYLMLNNFRHCETCGWNDEVAKKRLAKFSSSLMKNKS